SGYFRNGWRPAPGARPPSPHTNTRFPAILAFAHSKRRSADAIAKPPSSPPRAMSPLSAYAKVMIAVSPRIVIDRNVGPEVSTDWPYATFLPTSARRAPTYSLLLRESSVA